MTELDHTIIRSRTDLDCYKFSMAQAVFHNYTNVSVKYEFTCRSANVNLAQYIPFIKEEIRKMGNLRFWPAEIAGMREKIPFLQDDFFQYLSNSTLNPDFVKICEADVQGGMRIVIEGPWLDTIWFEIPILAIISEVYVFDQLCKQNRSEAEVIEEAKAILRRKIENACDKYGLEKFPCFADFGTRRRASGVIHRELLSFLKTSGFDCCIGTSNVMLGLDLDMKIIGTMAHEWIMAHAGFTRFDLSQKMALDVWQKEYRDKLGVALTDTYTTDLFLKDFDGLFARSFAGVRQDSGDPVEVGYKFIRHYESLGIDPMTKQIIFSDGLNFDKIAQLYKEFYRKIQVGFGIGTNLTADLGPDINPLNAVIKMSYVRRGNGVWWPLIKISDSPGKIICPDQNYKEFIMYLVNNIINH